MGTQRHIGTEDRRERFASSSVGMGATMATLDDLTAATT
jgi:hypothetical protein